MRTHPRHSPRAASGSRPARLAARLGIVALGAALVAACGAASAPGAGGGPLLAYARCIRAHGVPGFPDPVGGHGLAIPDDINPASPAFISAERACSRLAAGPADAGGAAAGSRREQLLAAARCMRAHGDPGFADPTSSPPPPSDGNALGGNGSYLALGTASERRSPAYRRAASACGLTVP